MEAGQKAWEQEGEVRNGRVPRCSGSSLHGLMAQSTQDVNRAEQATAKVSCTETILHRGLETSQVQSIEAVNGGYGCRSGGENTGGDSSII